MVTREELEARRAEIAASPQLQGLLARLTEKAAPVIERAEAGAGAGALHIPEFKAQLSRDGGTCEVDGQTLVFDPFKPAEHLCPRCGRAYRGERHDRHAARMQHLWVAERAAHLASLGALGGHQAAAVRAAELLTEYGTRYFRYPNSDNVLGPSRLFFSTYLESLWILNYLAAAMLLREADLLGESAAAAVSRVADEAANLIGDFDEGFSNRQTWNNAALAAIAAWFEDEDLGRVAIEGQTGLVAHLRGFREDGMWYEGENYHLFTLRGFVTGAAWARLAGVDVFHEPRLRDRVIRALLAPALTALPDFTFPARKDARFGVSLAHPMYLETWEVALGMLNGGETDTGAGEITSWLHALYGSAAPASGVLDSYLHESPQTAPLPVSRAELSWWALLWMREDLPQPSTPWSPPSTLLRGQGVAVLRNREGGQGRSGGESGDPGSRYVSLECGPLGGGHGHADRLHLTLHAGGVHWLRDYGTGSYLTHDLFWYRSTLAHNAPIVNGFLNERSDALCEQFDVHGGEWGWVRGRVGDVSRTVVSGPRYVIDVVDLSSEEERTLALLWHLDAAASTASGTWQTMDALPEIASDFIKNIARFVPGNPSTPIILEAAAADARLAVHISGTTDLWRAEGPGAPYSEQAEPFVLLRARGKSVRLVTLLEPHHGARVVQGMRVSGDIIEVEVSRAEGEGIAVERHELARDRWVIRRKEQVVQLAGPVEMDPPFRPLLDLEPLRPATGVAFRQNDPPALDGTPAGFDTSEPLRLEVEDQYRRSEEPYPGPEELSAVAYAGWDEEALYLAVLVRKPELWFRPADAAPLRLDNEPEDINSDGLQVYVQPRRHTNLADDPVQQFLLVPEERDGGLRIRVVDPPDPALDSPPPPAPRSGAPVRGMWRRTEEGYCVTLAISWPADYRADFGHRLGFDLIINEMRSGRQRRAGQLVWSGGNGWVWLRGDRQAPSRFGVLELVG